MLTHSSPGAEEWKGKTMEFIAGKIKYANQLFKQILTCRKKKWEVHARVNPSGKITSAIWVSNGYSWSAPQDVGIPVKIETLRKKLLKDAENYRELYSEEIEAEIKFHQEPKISIHTRAVPQGVPKPDDYEKKAKRLISFYKLAPELLATLKRCEKELSGYLMSDYETTSNPHPDEKNKAVMAARELIARIEGES